MIGLVPTNEKRKSPPVGFFLFSVFLQSVLFGRRRSVAGWSGWSVVASGRSSLLPSGGSLSGLEALGVVGIG